MRLWFFDFESEPEAGINVAHNWAVHMHSPNVVPRTDFEGHTTSLRETADILARINVACKWAAYNVG